MISFEDKLVELRESCLRCWAYEFGDIFPQVYNSHLASQVMNEYGNPEHTRIGCCKFKEEISLPTLDW